MLNAPDLLNIRRALHAVNFVIDLAACFLQKVEIITIQGLKDKYEGDKNTIMSTLGLSEGEAWRALRHYNWCALAQILRRFTPVVQYDQLAPGRDRH